MTIDGLVVNLLRNCREYQRRNKGTFRKDVEEGLRELEEREGGEGGGGGGGGEKRPPDTDNPTSSSPPSQKARKVDNNLNQTVSDGYAKAQAGQAKNGTGKDSKDGKVVGVGKTRRQGGGQRKSGGGSMGGNLRMEKSSLATRPTTRYSDLGGISGILQTCRELVEYPLLHPEIYR